MRLIRDLLKHTVRGPKGCLLWKGAKRDGYGRVQRNGRNYSVHVLVYEQVHGPVPKGKVVRHKCNTRACIRLNHLILGTQHANIMDSVRAGTHKNPVHPGASHPLAKLSPAQVREIRARAQAGWSHARIAKGLPVGRRQVSRIVEGVRWKGPEDVTEAMQRTFEVD